MQLAKLEIEALRGIPKDWPSIPISEKGLVVYGPNGSGKSSIIDGIEFALQKESSLYAEARQGVNWERGSQHIRGGTKRAELFYKLQGAVNSLSFLTGAPAEVLAWKVKAADATFVLRRHMLLKFITSQPADRYGSLEGFFNLQEYSHLETRLLSLLNSARTNESGLQVAVTSKAQALRVALGLAPTDVLNAAVAESKLADALVAAGLKDAPSSEARKERRAEIVTELQGLAADARLTELASLKSRVSEILPSVTFDTMLLQLAELQQALEKACSESLATAPAEFLKHAKTLISEQQMSECPVCEQAIDSLSVMNSLDLRIANDVKVTEARAAYDMHRSAVLSPISLHSMAFTTLISAWKKVFGEDLPKAYADESEFLKELVLHLQASHSLNDLPEVRARLKATINNHTALLARIDEELISAGGARRSVLSKALELLDIVQKDVGSYSSAVLHFKSSSETRTLLERVHGHALQARRDTVQGIVVRLSALANEYYEFIHPGENISKSALEVRPIGRGSVELSTSFHGQSEHPLLHFSESHLDTLGLCYFLAARRLESVETKEFKLLVLDDVVHSVDSDHRERIARLLKSKFSDHQLIIVTHDSVFYQRLRANLGNQFEYLYFTNWSLDGGPVRIQGSTDIDRVTNETIRKTKSPEELAAACGRFSEWLFMQLTERLAVAIPARFARPHDIGSLWPALAAKLKKHRFFGAAKRAVVEEVDASQWVRNKVGAHYNEPESPVTPAEVQKFAESLSDLYSATFCEPCGTSIMKIKDDHWRCECGVVEYSPPPPGSGISESNAT